MGGGHRLRDQADLDGARRRDRIAEQHQRKGVPRQGEVAEIGHDHRRRQAVRHLGERQLRAVGHQGKVAQDGETEAEAGGVALDFGNADEIGAAQRPLVLDDARSFPPQRFDVAPGALAAGAEGRPFGAQAQHARLGQCRLGAQLGHHRVHHGARDVIAGAAVEREDKLFTCALDQHSRCCLGVH